MVRSQELVVMMLALLDTAKISQAQRYEFLGLLSAAIMTGVNPPNQTGQQASSPTGAIGPVAVAEVTPQPGGPVWITAGSMCVCKACKKEVYRIIKDIPERVKTEDFLASFEPIGPAPMLTEDIDIYGDPYGNQAINCPLCKGTKTLWIKGEGDYESLMDGAT